MCVNISKKIIILFTSIIILGCASVETFDDLDTAKELKVGFHLNEIDVKISSERKKVSFGNNVMIIPSDSSKKFTNKDFIEISKYVGHALEIKGYNIVKTFETAEQILLLDYAVIENEKEVEGNKVKIYSYGITINSIDAEEFINNKEIDEYWSLKLFTLFYDEIPEDIFPLMVIAAEDSINETREIFNRIDIKDSRLKDYKNAKAIYFNLNEIKNDNTILGDVRYVAGVAEDTSLGFSWKTNIAGEAKIISFLEHMNAKDVLLVGDTIISINGIEVSKDMSIDKIIEYLSPGEIIIIRIKRYGEIMDYKIRTGSYKILSHAKEIKRLLIKNEEVRLAIIVDEIEVLTARELEKASEGYIEKWKKSVSSELAIGEEAVLLKTFDSYGNFSIVDRRELEKVLEEQRFQLSGIVNESVEIGNLLGATHLLLIDLSRYEDLEKPNGIIEIITMRLISTENGQVISTVVKEEW